MGKHSQAWLQEDQPPGAHRLQVTVHKAEAVQCAIASTISAVYSRVSASSKMPCSRHQPNLQRLPVLCTLLMADT